MHDRPAIAPPVTHASAPRRAAVRLLEQAAAPLGIRVQRFCGDWVIRLTHADGRTRLVWGYNFDLNPSAGAHVAKDKAATFEILRAAGVPALEHRLFLRADLADYVADGGNWRDMLAALEEFGGEAVIKPTEGSGGAGVRHVRSPRELEEAAAGLWQGHHAVCLSPFVQVRREVRHILLDGKPGILYEKRIGALVGDGRRALGQLLLERLGQDPSRWAALLAGAARMHGGLAWDEVPPAGQRLPLGWKHNLRGARAQVLQEADEAMLQVATAAAGALGLRICAVDVIETAGASGPMVLEVNAGLMLERYVEQIEAGWEQALALTSDVLRLMFK